MIQYDRSPQAPNKIYCKYCNSWVDNNKKAVNTHNTYITHNVNVKKWNAQRKKEKIESDVQKKEIDEELAVIQAKAQTQHILQDVMKSDNNILRDEHEKQQENYDLARELYGDELFEQMVEPKKKKQTKTEIYNNFMKSLPTRIQKKHRQQISEFKGSEK